MERVQLQAAFILHQRPWRDTSRLIEAFTRAHGRLGMIAKGARRPKSRLKAVLQPFQPVLLSWTSRGDLATLTGAEATDRGVNLVGSRLFCGFYANELVIRLLHRHDPHPRLFDAYGDCLNELAESPREEVPLRLFEKRLLAACGYGLNLTAEIDTGEAVKAAHRYEYILEQGPRESRAGTAGLMVSGASLLALAADRLDEEEARRDAKRLLRAAIDLYLGGKPLKTRQVLRNMRRR